MYTHADFLCLNRAVISASLGITLRRTVRMLKLMQIDRQENVETHSISSMVLPMTHGCPRRRTLTLFVRWLSERISRFASDETLTLQVWPARQRVRVNFGPTAEMSSTSFWLRFDVQRHGRVILFYIQLYFYISLNEVKWKEVLIAAPLCMVDMYTRVFQNVSALFKKTVKKKTTKKTLNK